MKLIDEISLSQDICNYFKAKIDKGEYEVDAVDCHADIQAILRSQPTVDVPDTNVGEWIPCSERLPELGEHVLCMCRADIQEVMRLTPDGWFHDTCHCYMEGFVIAWMPLPEPYKESD